MAAVSRNARVVIAGAGFAGLNAAKVLGNRAGIEVTVLDRLNHHVFQPLLYQVAMAALSPADIAAPIRSILHRKRNVRVLQASVQSVDLGARKVICDCGEFAYDYLLLACGATHAYFGHEGWECHAPGLKSLSQATEIRRRVLSAFEEAERETDRMRQERLLTFVVVGGGPTGVELAGAIGEMARYTLSRDFRQIDPRHARVILVEAGPRILPAFTAPSAARATRDLESLGVEVRVSSAVTSITREGVTLGTETIPAATVLWAAGVRASDIGRALGVPADSAGRVIVEADLSLPGHPDVFVLGDLAHALDQRTGRPLPGVATVAMQQGIYVARTILSELAGESRAAFRFVDMGQMATIGRARAVSEFRQLRFAGRFAWWFWLLVHIYRLTGFRNRLSVMVQWGWSFLTFDRGARLIVPRGWREYGAESDCP
jgi:NADH:ubiquinone reductase (H+-translocating)